MRRGITSSPSASPRKLNDPPMQLPVTESTCSGFGLFLNSSGARGAGPHEMIRNGKMVKLGFKMGWEVRGGGASVQIWIDVGGGVGSDGKGSVGD